MIISCLSFYLYLQASLRVWHELFFAQPHKDMPVSPYQVSLAPAQPRSNIFSLFSCLGGGLYDLYLDTASSQPCGRLTIWPFFCTSLISCLWGAVFCRWLLERVSSSNLLLSDFFFEQQDLILNHRQTQDLVYPQSMLSVERTQKKCQQVAQQLNGNICMLSMCLNLHKCKRHSPWKTLDEERQNLWNDQRTTRYYNMLSSDQTWLYIRIICSQKKKKELSEVLSKPRMLIQ